MAAVVMSSMSNIPVEAATAAKYQAEGLQGFEATAGAVIRYANSLEKTITVDGDIDYEQLAASMPQDLMPVVSPAYGYIPSGLKLDGQLNWSISPSIAYGETAVAICLSPATAGTGSQKQHNVLARIQRKLPQGASFLSSSCGDLNNVENGTALTYHIIVRHYEKPVITIPN